MANETKDKGPERSGRRHAKTTDTAAGESGVPTDAGRFKGHRKRPVGKQWAALPTGTNNKPPTAEWADGKHARPEQRVYSCAA